MDNNIEKTGDRDLRWSQIMRQPSKKARGCGKLRSCDWDTNPICDGCGLPIIMLEVTRQLDYSNKACRYTKSAARRLGVPAYLAWHGGSGDKEKITITNLATGVRRDFTLAAFCLFIEDKMRGH